MPGAKRRATKTNTGGRIERSKTLHGWMATMALSSASTPSGGKLGKLVGAMALGFEMRDVPQNIKHMMQGNIRRWYNKGGKKRKGSGETPPRGGRAKQGLSNSAWAMGGGVAGAGAGGAAVSKWGQMPAGGWKRNFCGRDIGLSRGTRARSTRSVPQTSR